MRRTSLLGDYLRACRDRVSPADAGLEPLGPRRVPGLRREEVALLAGISADYYLRLEQGRDRHPSEQVLAALARALRLDRVQTTHLLALGRPSGGRDRAGAPAEVPASIRQLLHAMEFPAWVQDAHLDVLAANRMARLLSPQLRPGGNRLRSVFLDPDERALFADWHVVAGQLVASFRATIAGDADDARTTELVDELSARDPTFRELWARQAVADRVDRPPVRFTHPAAGPLTLLRDNLGIDGPAALRLMIYHPEPDSDDLTRLAGCSAVAPIPDEDQL